MPPHKVYIEPFLGRGAVLRNKRPAEQTIGIDINPDVLACWSGNEIPNLELLQGDAVTYLKGYRFKGDELVYADPPYLMGTRSYKKAIYKNEFTDWQHVELLKVLKRLKCKVMISGYWSKLYAALLNRWRCISFQTTTRGGKAATEFVWMNYAEPLELHDYRYLGNGFRERERIRRRVKRWKANFIKMPALERHAILAALEEARAAAVIADSGEDSGVEVLSEL